MNIREQEDLAVMDDVAAALDKNGMSEDVKKDVIAMTSSLKGEVIRM